MTAHLSSDSTMYKAYAEGKDLYAMIAQSAFDNKYEDNLEWYTSGTVVSVDGSEMVSGSGKERYEKTENNSISVKYYEILETVLGEKSAQDITKDDLIISDVGNLKICSISRSDDIITFTFCE